MNELVIDDNSFSSSSEEDHSAAYKTKPRKDYEEISTLTVPQTTDHKVLQETRLNASLINPMKCLSDEESIQKENRKP